MFKLKFDTDNAAFDDGMRNVEVARILRELADQVENSASARGDGGTVHDFNGSRVGSWALE